jgi:hypothetical protein
MFSPGFQVLKLALAYNGCSLLSGARLYGSYSQRNRSKSTHSSPPSRASEQTMVNTGEAAEIVPPLLFNSGTLRWPSGYKFKRLRDRPAVNWYLPDGECNIQQEKCYKLLVSCQGFSENTILHPNAYFVNSTIRVSTYSYVHGFSGSHYLNGC